MEEVKRMTAALRYCANHAYCEGCPEYGTGCMEWTVKEEAAEMIERLAAELEEERRKNGGRG